MPPGAMGGRSRSRWRSSAWLLQCVLALACVGCALAADAQGAALLAWKRTLRGGAEALGDWRDTDASPCRWMGMTCDAAGRVTELSLCSSSTCTAACRPTSPRWEPCSRGWCSLLTDTNLMGPSPRSSRTCRGAPSPQLLAVPPASLSLSPASRRSASTRRPRAHAACLAARRVFRQE